MKKRETWQKFLRSRSGECVTVDRGDTTQGQVSHRGGVLTVAGEAITEAPKAIHAAGFACWRPA